MRRFEESMRSLHQGTRKSGRMVTISGDIQLMPLNFPSKDLTGRDDIVEEIYACFGVPVSMLKANDPNLASAQAGYSMWRETTIAPICRMDEETLNSRLLPLFGIHEDAYLAYDNPVPENRLADSQERAVAVAGGWRTPNEARLEEGYEELNTPQANRLGGASPMGMPMSPFQGMSPAAQRPEEATAATAPLNGAQIDSSLKILLAVSAGSIAPEAASGLLIALGIDPQKVAAMILAQDKIDLTDVVALDENAPLESNPVPEAVEPKQIESDEMRTARLDSARIQIAAMEAKAWDAVHQQPKIDQLQQELDDMKHRTKSLDEIVTMLTEALGDES